MLHCSRQIRCTKKLDCTQRTCHVLAEQEDVVHISLPSSDCFVTRIPFILTQLQDDICVVTIFLWTLVSFQRQPGLWTGRNSVVCSDIFPARVFRGPGMWGAPILHHHCSQGLCMENSTDITRRSRSWQCPQAYQLPVEGKKWQSITFPHCRRRVLRGLGVRLSHYCNHSECYVLPRHLSFAQKAEFFLRGYIMSSQHPFYQA